jgi:PEP-CTERM motif
MQRVFKATSLALATALCAMASSAQAASGFAFLNLSGAEYDTAGVFVLGDIKFTGTVDDGGGLDKVHFTLWDDGVHKFDADYSVAVGTTGTFHFEVYYPGLVGTAAQGVGLYLYDSPSTAIATFIDPYNVPHYKDPSQCQKDCGPVPGVPEPSEYAMMLMGLGVVGYLARRRKSRAG